MNASNTRVNVPVRKLSSVRSGVRAGCVQCTIPTEKQT